MWQRLAGLVLKYRKLLLVILLLITGVMGYFASHIQLSYEFSKAIPTDNPRYQEYLSFKKKFGDDGNVLVLGVQTKDFFKAENFNQFSQLGLKLQSIPYVENVLSVANAVNLLKDSSTQKLITQPVFSDTRNQSEIEHGETILYRLPFYNGLLYNKQTDAYLMIVRINKDVLNSKGRTKVINNILAASNSFTASTNIQVHLSGLPLIRTQVADRIAKEMKWFIVGSLALSALILLILFRSLVTMALSLSVVLIGVTWSVGLTYLLGYKITLLTALIPPLIVVIGIPNCIYFLNKYHTTYRQTNDKNASLIAMVSKMGVVTLFCNITAAIGFAVFALTNSAILKEFGQVAGIGIMFIFLISFILLPAALSFMKAPVASQLKYLDFKAIIQFLLKIEQWVFNHQRIVYLLTGLLIIFSLFGMAKIRSEGFIVDDLPKDDKIYKDLKFFENNFKGVMPLEIIVDTKKRGGLSGARILPVLKKMDSLSLYITGQPEMSRPLSVAEGMKFVKEGFYEGDSSNYSLPNTFDLAFIGDYLKGAKTSTNNNSPSSLLNSFMDTAHESTRMSINMADVGTRKLPLILNALHKKSDQLFDSSKYKITYTGSTITFLEGSAFIIEGLKESILWAFLFISLCMLYLFKSVRILLCSLIPNLIPLVVTAGIMGWAGVRLKPSTVLVFSIALGIAVDVTIRFLVNYKQELPTNNNNIAATIGQTINQTGLSIIYTSMVLIAGFIIFCFSGFGGTQSLGWLTSITLLLATLANLILLPVLLLNFTKIKKK
ncbi:MAG: MMPL family transporter [Bacteroidetes bacterium]|nr:MMPL family transporter [Bacteroidota bacterium]